MKYEKFKQIRYRVLDQKADADFMKAFPSLFHNPVFLKFYTSGKQTRTYKNRVITYISLLYDKKSELIAEYLQLKDRKMAAANLSGFLNNKQQLLKDYEPWVILEDIVCVRLILEFLKIQDSFIWTEICTTEQELEEITELRWEKIQRVTIRKSKKSDEEEIMKEQKIRDSQILDAAGKKGKLLDESRKRVEYLEVLYEKFYADNKDVEAKVKDIPITPENASKIDV